MTLLGFTNHICRCRHLTTPRSQASMAVPPLAAHRLPLSGLRHPPQGQWREHIPPHPGSGVCKTSGIMCKVFVPSIFIFCGILGLLVDFLWSIACLPSAGLCQVGCNQSWLFSKMLFLTKHFGLRFTCWELNNLIPIQSKARARACHGEINGLGYRWEERRRRRGLNSPWGSRRLWCQKVVEPRTDVTRGMASVEEITENL